MKKILFILAIMAFSFALVRVVFADRNDLDPKRLEMERVRSMLANKASSTPTSTPGYDVVCMQNAVSAREDGIISANNTRTTELNTALQNRKNALVSAWGIADRTQRNKARNLAWTNYNKARRTVRNTYNTATKAVWKTYHAAAKACGVNSKGVEPEGNDQSYSD